MWCMFNVWCKCSPKLLVSLSGRLSQPVPEGPLHSKQAGRASGRYLLLKPGHIFSWAVTSCLVDSREFLPSWHCRQKLIYLTNWLRAAEIHVCGVALLWLCSQVWTRKISRSLLLIWFKKCQSPTILGGFLSWVFANLSEKIIPGRKSARNWKKIPDVNI